MTIMNDFGRKQLEKYGWTKGKGLGKQEDGIKKPVSGILKLDTHGIGHDSVNVLASRWWCDIFNQASNRINVVETKTGVNITNEKQYPDPVMPSVDRIKKVFVKTGTLVDQTKQDEEHISTIGNQNPSNLSPDALYEKCEGVKNKSKRLFKAKHRRIKRQDAMYVKQRKSTNNSTNSSLKSR